MEVEWLCVDFLNSDWRDWRGSGRRENRLEKAEWMEAFLHKWNLTAPQPAPQSELASLLSLRHLLRQMVEAVVEGKAISVKDLDALNQVLALSPSHLRLSLAEQDYRLEQVSASGGWDNVMGRIAESFADLLVHQDRRRLKICDNRDCQWVFFDESRNRVRRWCDDKACGNLMKVRRFRERQKEKGEA